MVLFLSMANLSLSGGHRQHSASANDVSGIVSVDLSIDRSMVAPQPQSFVDEGVQVDRQEVDSEAYIMACDYIHTKLRKCGLDWPQCPELPEPSPLRLAMRSLGDEFERKYKQVFDGMCDSLHVTPTSAYPTFFGVADELFREGVTWGRVVALFAFGGSLAEYCGRKQTPQLVTYVADWVALYAETHLSQWIVDNGGWDGFLRFYEKRPQHYSWNSLKRVMTGFGAICGALGVVTLGAMLAIKS